MPRPPRLREVTRRMLLAALAGAALAPAADAATLEPLSRILVELRPPVVPPAFSFLSAGGVNETLADYRGEGIVLNIWATWCVPCVAEMPALDRLLPKVRPFSIAVLPVSIDLKGLAVVRKFYTAHAISDLPILLDPDGGIAAAFRVPGIPASFIIDRTGRIVARSEGPAQWDAPDAVARIRRLVGPPWRG